MGDGCIRVVEADSGTIVRVLSSHSGPVRSIVAPPGGRFLVSGSDDGTMCAWDITTGRPAMSYNCGACGGIRSMCMLGTQYIVAGCGDGRVRIWNAEKGTQVRTLDAGGGGL